MTQDKSQPIRHDDVDLDWLAYQYLVGELSEHDAASFEQRLAIDQVAREALAAAVELAESVSIAGEATVSPASLTESIGHRGRRDGFWLRPVGSLAASAAAALVFAALLQLLWPANQQAESAFDTSLLSEWTQLRDITSDGWSDAVSRSDLSESEWNGLAATTVPEDFSESSWLLTALAPDAVIPGDSNVHQQ
jgi:hypothetical protein